MKNMLVLALVAGMLPVAAVTPASAHPGGLNAQGCHNNRRTGDYHCHRGPQASRAPVRRTSASPATWRAFINCREARAYGAAPVHRGEPGYGRHLDRDRDGIGCE